MLLWTSGSFKSANHKKDWVPKCDTPRSVTFATVAKSDKLFKSVHFRNHDLRKFIAGRATYVTYTVNNYFLL
jgi:hypothetical protein